MSNNEENHEASTPDAAADAAAPAPNATTEARPVTPAPNAATAADTRSTSRFYSRLRRGIQSPAKEATTTGQLFNEGLTADQAVNLRDDLPVRATVGEHAVYTGPGGGGGDEPRGRGRERFERGGGEGDDRRERGGRGRDRERGGRGRDRDRDRGPRDRDRPRDEHTSPTTPHDSGAPVDTGDEWNDAPKPPIAAEAGGAAASADTGADIAPAASTPPPSPAAPEQPRRLRFEDAAPEAAPRSVQEFRPSRDRSYADDASRARRDQGALQDDKKAPGLFGWMKSIFTPAKPDAESGESSPAATPERRPERGPRGGQPRAGGYGQGGGGQHQRREEGDRGGGGGGEGGGDFPGGKRRRRRRRGGRNRNREGGGGPSHPTEG